MKILSVQFENLNSLKGKSPLIQLDQGPLADSGIFAITGPTGSGKTTILDAIAIALYGETPRLKSGKNGVGNLMTKQTGNAFSEVVFSTGEKSFRSRWQIRRARNKPTGNIQAAEMELVELKAEEEKIIEEKASKVPAKVTELSGLDFKRFCRSVMLAQGDFAAFLEANENDRAELLEKMTGTEVYAQISQLVFQRKNREKTKLERLHALLEGIQLLDSEELEKVLEKKEQLEQELSTATTKNSETEKGITWLKNIEEQQKLLEKIVLEQEQLTKEEESATEWVQQLANHAKATELKSELELLANNREKRNTLQKQRTQLDEERTQLLLNLEETQKKHQKTEKESQKFTTEKEKQEAIIPDVIRLDQQIENRETQIKSERDKSKKYSESIREHREEKTLLEKQSLAFKNDLETSRSYLEQHKEDQSLLEEFSLLKERIEELPIKREALKTAETKRTTIEANIKKYEEKAKRKRVSINAAKESRNKIAESIGKIEKEFEEKRGDKSVETIESEVETTTQRMVLWEKAIDVGNRIVTIEKRQQSVTGELEKANKEREKSLKQEKELEEALRKSEKEVEYYERVREQEIRIKKYEEDRKQLKPGEQCPLCGATEHPFGQEIPDDSETKVRIQNEKKNLQTIQKHLRETTGKKEAQLQKQKELEKQSREFSTEREKFGSRWEALLKMEKLAPTPESLNILQKRLAEDKDKQEKIREKIKSLKSMEKLLDKERKKEIAAEREQNKEKLELEKIEGTLEKDKALLQQQIEDVRACDESCRVSLRTVAEKLSPLKLSLPDENKEAECVDLLHDRYELFKKHREGCYRNEKDLAVTQKNLESLSHQLEKEEEQQKQQNEALNRLEKENQAQRLERKELFGDQDPDKVRQTLKTREASLQESLKNSKALIDREEKALAQNRTLHKKSISDLEQLTDSLKIEEDKVSEKAKFHGFQNEEAARNAILDKERVQELETLRDDLKKRKTQIETRQKDTEKRLKTERKKELTTLSKEKLLEQKEKCEETLKSLNRELGAQQETLNTQEKLRKQQGERIKEIEAQEREMKRWKTMDDLIGSQSGNKFRRFAQGITHEYLIRLANQHLRNLTDRYLLQRTELEDLGLEVIDTYQADEKRPTKTLSGGESFLVSLSLALALSQLSSRRTQVDSLFLDEGFGTLDPDTLDIALSALHNLNAIGKTIGIISHVEALKERIPIQIQVNKKSGGISEILITE